MKPYLKFTHINGFNEGTEYLSYDGNMTLIHIKGGKIVETRSYPIHLMISYVLNGDWNMEIVNPKSKYAPYDELKAAHKAGKVIQIDDGTDWKDISDPLWSLHPSQYRIKPEPKTVPLSDPADWITGGPWWIRAIGKKGFGAMVIAVTERYGVSTCDGDTKWSELHKFERTNDGKTWHPCTKEVAE